MKGRDGFIDGCKGLLVLWVVHIHTVFWSGDLYLSDGVRQRTLLIDIAAFFFISGYLMDASGFTDSLRKTAKQFFRLYSRYIVISFVILLCLLLQSYAFQREGAALLPSAITSVMRLKPAGPLWETIRVYEGSLWFIRVFLSMLLFVPPLIGITRIRRLRIPLLAALLALFTMLRYRGWDRDFLFIEAVYVGFYLFLTILGTVYRKEEQAISLRSLVLALPLTAALCLAAYGYDGRQLILQGNKFPPTFQYLAYSLPLIHLFVIAKRVWKPPAWKPLRHTGRFLRWCGRNVYTLYLFQGVACSLPYYFIPALRQQLSVPALYAAAFLCNLGFTFLFAGLFLKLEAAVMGRRRVPEHSGRLVV